MATHKSQSSKPREWCTHVGIRVWAISGPGIMHHGQSTQNLNHFTLKGDGYHLYKMFRAIKIILPGKPSNHRGANSLCEAVQEF